MYFSFRIHCISTVYKAHIVSQKLQLMHRDRVGTVQKVREWSITAVISPLQLSNCHVSSDVCVRVCQSHVGVLSKRRNGSTWFWHGGFLPPILYAVLTGNSGITHIK